MPASFVTTARNALRSITGGSKISDLDEGILALANDVDTKMASLWVDTFAKRPAAGQPNRIFRASDTGAYYFDTGGEWIAVVQYASGTAAGRPAAGRQGRIYYATDTGTAALDTGSVWVPVLTVGSAWQGRTARALATAFTPNATRPTQVLADVSLAPTPGFGKSAVFYVNGVAVGEVFAGGSSVESGYRMSFGGIIVPAGATWQVNDTTGSGGVSGLVSNYLTL